MKNIIVATLVAVTTLATGAASAAKNTTQPYIWASGEAGLIVNPDYKSDAAADKSEGLLIVGVGEKESRVNPRFANLPNMMHTPLFKAGVGEISLIDLAPIVMAKMAMK